MEKQNPKFTKSLIDHKVNIQKLQRLLHDGEAILQRNLKNEDAVMIIGDSGVGKSTVMCFLKGEQLIVEQKNFNMILKTKDYRKSSIGHNLVSHTTVPQKSIIDGMAFYDCPGFLDNKGSQYEISNAYFVKRLFSSHKNIKILLLISFNEYLKQARLKSFSILLENLQKSFGNLQHIKDGVVILVTKADRQHSKDQFYKQLQNIINTKNEDSERNYILGQKRVQFIRQLLRKDKILFFRQPDPHMKGRIFIPNDQQKQILHKLKYCQFIRKTKINVILSHKSQLVMTEMMYEIERQSISISKKIQTSCDQYAAKAINKAYTDVSGIKKVKEQIQNFRDDIIEHKQQQILDFLQKIHPKSDPGHEFQHIKTDFKIMLCFYKITQQSQKHFKFISKTIVQDLDELLKQVKERIDRVNEYNRNHTNNAEKTKLINHELQKHCHQLKQYKRSVQNLKQSNKKLKDHMDETHSKFKNDFLHKLDKIQASISSYERKRTQQIEQFKKILKKHE